MALFRFGTVSAMGVEVLSDNYLYVLAQDEDGWSKSGAIITRIDGKFYRMSSKIDDRRGGAFCNGVHLTALEQVQKAMLIDTFYGYTIYTVGDMSDLVKIKLPEVCQN